MNIDEVMKASKEEDRLTKEEILEIWQYCQHKYEGDRWMFHRMIETAYTVGLMEGQKSK